METLFNSPTDFIFIASILLLAQTIYVMLGFGLGLISISLLVFLLPSFSDIVTLLLFVCFPAEIYVVYKSRNEISWKGISTILAGVAVGVVLGTYILAQMASPILLVVLGIFLIASGFAFVGPIYHWRIQWPKWISPLIGFVSGLLAALFGTGGPPLVLYYHLAGINKKEFRGHLMAIFLIMTSIRIPSYGFAGFFSLKIVYAAAMLLPVTLLGIWLGNHIHLKIPERKFRDSVNIFLMIVGVLIVIKSINSLST